MRKVISVSLTLLLAMTMGIAFIHCGGDDNGAECPDVCGEGNECCDECPCETGTCEDGQCVSGGDCCPSSPAGEYWIDITGSVKDATTAQGVEVAVAAISPNDALVSDQPTLLSEAVSDASGDFYLDCYDVTSVALGAVVLADDDPMDAGAGDYFPTGTGVAGWETSAEKVCVENAAAFVVPNTMVGLLDQLADVDSANDGFVMGLVVSAAGAPVEGAVIKKSMDGGDTWVDLGSVYYPSTDVPPNLTDGTATSANGSYVIPGSEVSSLSLIHAEKDGMTFDTAQVAGKGGFCFFAMIPEAS